MERSSSTGASRARRRPRVLVVNQGAAERDLFSASLRSAGFEVQVATGGLEALAHAVARRPDAIVMAAGAPKLDAGELTRRLQAAAATRDIPVIAMSGRAFHPEDLGAEVERQLGRHRPRPRRRGRAGRL
jgi:CheY-like chemotaxis protein